MGIGEQRGNSAAIRGRLETYQIAVYLIATGLGIAAGMMLPETSGRFEAVITPVLAALIYTTFLQISLADLRSAMANKRFVGALLVANFVAVPILVWALFQMVPSNPAVQLGVLLVLLTPCIDYVVVFTHLGRGNSRLVLAATPTLLIVQILLLPVYLWLFLGSDSAELLRPGPFLEAFLWLIAAPLILAWLTELWAKRHKSGERFTDAMGWGPVPLMALTLFLVVGAEVPRIESARGDILGVIPVYVAYVVAAPIIGLGVARLFSLDTGGSRALMFSVSTRNSLVVLPLEQAELARRAKRDHQERKNKQSRHETGFLPAAPKEFATTAPQGETGRKRHWRISAGFGGLEFVAKTAPKGRFLSVL